MQSLSLPSIQINPIPIVRNAFLHSHHRFGPSLPQRILIFRALKLGDLLCVVPALRALRAALPQAEIVLLGLPWAARFVQRFRPYLDGFWEFPGYPGLPERLPQWFWMPAFLTAIQAQQFDLVLQMHGSGSIVNPLMVLLGGQLNAGFYRPGEFCPDRERFLPYLEAEPEVWRYLRLLNYLGVPAQGLGLEFPLGAADWQALAAIPAAASLRPGTYACLHPGASTACRCWSAVEFAQIGDRLSRLGLQVVLTGTAGEAERTAAVAAAMQTPVLDLVGQTSLGALAALLSRARLLVCNDTGVSHLASALQVKSVVIFTGSDPARWAPLDRDRHRVVWGGQATARAEAIAQVEELVQREAIYGS